MTDALLDLTVESSVRVTVLAAAVVLLMALLRIRVNAVRHSVWRAVLATMLLMPALAGVTLPISLPVPVAAVPALPTFEASPEALRETIVTVPSVTVPAPTAEPLPDSREPFPWRVLLLGAYAAVLAGFLLRFAAGSWHLARIRRSSRVVSPGIFESPLIAAPVTIGAVQPRVVLPLEWKQWPADMLEAVLTHERTHAARRDPLFSLLARLNCAVFWFHPLAWWLKRVLATTAEHACDDAALRSSGGRQRYAEMLIEIASTTRRHQGRLVWQSAGVGHGSLEDRIERILHGAPEPPASRRQQSLAAVSVALVTLLVVACTREVVVSALREDPELAAALEADQNERAQREERMTFMQSARRMRPEDVAALEAGLKLDPDNLVARERLLSFYLPKLEANAAARRPHALWLAEHHAESDLWTYPLIPRQWDPQGYARARAFWLSHVEKPDVTPTIMRHAAEFFIADEKPVAEQLLIRARARWPDPTPATRNVSSPQRWSFRLGYLYGSAIRDGDPFAQDARAKLEVTTDAGVLTGAALVLVRLQRTQPANEDLTRLGRSYVERASRLDGPFARDARSMLRTLDQPLVRRDSSAGASRAEPPERAATPAERLSRLATQAESDYLMGEFYDWRARRPADNPRRSETPERDQQSAVARFAKAKDAAREVIDLAPDLKDAPEYSDALFKAHMAAGVLAWRDGNRRLAVQHLLDASRVPTPSATPREPRSALEYRLVNYLLKHGERDTIVEYYERAAESRNEDQRDIMLKAAEAIRAGRMPEHYQRLLALGHI